MSGREQLELTFILALPAILAQLSMCMMNCIDAAMVGRLGSSQAASVGLVSSTAWIFGSFCFANSSGFSVQIAHRCGARDFKGAAGIFRQGLRTVLLFSLGLAAAGISISSSLPHWLGGAPEIADDAFWYFLIYAASLPFLQFAIFCEASLVASGNVKVSSLTSIAMCFLDVGFNYLFIFVFNLGVKGAAIGTSLSTISAGIFLYIYAKTSCMELKERPDPDEDALTIRDRRRGILRMALNISWPLWLQNLISRGAYIAATVIIAPLGTIAIAANSFAIIAEGFCYLPGYGMQDAATTLTGQSLGAKRTESAKRFAWITICSGAAMMTFLAVLMWILAPQMMGLLSHDPAVVLLGAKCLRIEAWAELLFAVSIVAYGCCVGAGDTLVPSAINLLSMWVIRIGLALLLIPRFGLEGYWYAMATELCFKGVIFAIRIRSGRWLKTRLTSKVQTS